MKDPRHLHRVPWVFLLGSFFSMLREYSQDIMLHDTHPQDARHNPHKPANLCRDTRHFVPYYAGHYSQVSARRAREIKIDRPAWRVLLGKKQRRLHQNTPYAKLFVPCVCLGRCLLLSLTQSKTLHHDWQHARRVRQQQLGFQPVLRGNFGAGVSSPVAIGFVLASSLTTLYSASTKAAGNSERSFFNCASISSRLMFSYLCKCCASRRSITKPPSADLIFSALIAAEYCPASSAPALNSYSRFNWPIRSTPYLRCRSSRNSDIYSATNGKSRPFNNRLAWNLALLALYPACLAHSLFECRPSTMSLQNSIWRLVNVSFTFFFSNALIERNTFLNLKTSFAACLGVTLLHKCYTQPIVISNKKHSCNVVTL